MPTATAHARWPASLAPSPVIRPAGSPAPTRPQRGPGAAAESTDPAKPTSGGPQTSRAERCAQLVEGRCALEPLRGDVHAADKAEVGALVGEGVTTVDEDGG